MKSRSLLLVCLLGSMLMMSLVGCSAGSDKDENGDTGTTNVSTAMAGYLPEYEAGDSWTFRVTSTDAAADEMKMTMTITGEEDCNGKKCYSTKSEMDPPLINGVDTIVNLVDKQTFQPVSTTYLEGELFSSSVDIDYEMVGDKFPMTPGNRWTVSETEIQVNKVGAQMGEPETSTLQYEVGGIEEVTVPAGTFTCYKVLIYDEDGGLYQTRWVSEETKMMEVKVINHSGEGQETELTNFSIQ